MGDEATVEVHCQVGDVLDAVADVAGATGTDAYRWFLDEMVQDGDVVRCQIPEHVDIALDEAEVDAHRIEVVQLAQVAARNDLLHLAYRTGIDEGVVDHERKAAFGG